MQQERAIVLARGYMEIRPKCTWTRGAEAPLVCGVQRVSALELYPSRELQLTRMRRSIWEWSVADRSILVNIAAG